MKEGGGKLRAQPQQDEKSRGSIREKVEEVVRHSLLTGRFVPGRPVTLRGLAQDLGYTKKETRQLVSAVVLEQRPLVRLVSAGKITSANTVSGEPPA